MTTGRPRGETSRRAGTGARRNAGFVAAVSDFALIVLVAMDEFFDQCGMNPHRMKDNARVGSFGFWRIKGTGWVGAML